MTEERFVYETNAERSTKKKVLYKGDRPLYLTLSPNAGHAREPDRCIKHKRYLPDGAANCRECGRPVEWVRELNKTLLAKLREEWATKARTGA